MIRIRLSGQLGLAYSECFNSFPIEKEGGYMNKAKFLGLLFSATGILAGIYYSVKPVLAGVFQGTMSNADVGLYLGLTGALVGATLGILGVLIKKSI